MSRRSWSSDDMGRFYFKLVGQPGEAPTNSEHAKKSVVLLTVPEACALLRISKWGLYRLINSRRLKSIRIGSRRLVPHDAVMTLIEELRQEECF